ncbi:hypothetical protein [Pricia antarctica]|nr:hypothetical protein [Pricia antarctica]
MSGEYLYYEIYCRNAKTNSASSISKIAYVELVAENGKSVFRHKIFLEQGRGQGDFFVPVSVKSGNYKLVGYTQWMKNRGIDHFFQGDISIVNPYLSDQTPLLANTNDTLYTESNFKVEVEANRSRTEYRIDGEVLSLNDSVFSNREKVNLTFRAKSGASIQGDYSLSVRKVDSFTASPMISLQNFNPSETRRDSKAEHFFYIPEMRGDLISGTVTSIAENNPLKDAQIAMSIPGEEGMTKVANSDNEGIFYLNLDKPYTSGQAIFQVINRKKDQYRISIDPKASLEYTALSFYHFKLTPQMKDALLQRSVHNQIENAFFSVKPDTSVTAESRRPAYLDKMYFYDLDEYTRFPTVRETLVEIVNNVYSRKIDHENYRIQVRNYIFDSYVPPNAQPLVLVDGIFVQDHTYLLDYDARKIEKIGVLQDKYILGLQIFQGVVVMETIDGDFSLPETDAFTTIQQLGKPQERKKYFSPVYGDSLSQKERIPDFRHQLLWKPNIVIHEKEASFSFYTSDVNGRFEVSLKGFTTGGKAISLTESFLVE